MLNDQNSNWPPGVISGPIRERKVYSGLEFHTLHDPVASSPIFANQVLSMLNDLDHVQDLVHPLFGYIRNVKRCICSEFFTLEKVRFYLKVFESRCIPAHYAMFRSILYLGE